MHASRPQAAACAERSHTRPAPPPQTLDALRRRLSKAEADNKALERDAERFKRRQTLLTRLEDVTKKARRDGGVHGHGSPGGVPASAGCADSSLAGAHAAPSPPAPPLPARHLHIPTALQETWLAVEAKQAKLAEDSGVLDKLKDMLARHQAQVADDTAPLKCGARERV